MKKVILAMIILLATVSFTSCTDLTEEDETIFEVKQVDPSKVKPPKNG